MYKILFLLVVLTTVIFPSTSAYASEDQGTIPSAALEDYPGLDPRLIGMPIVKNDTTASLVLFSQSVKALNDLNAEKTTLDARLAVLGPEQKRAQELSSRAEVEYEQVYKAARDLLISQYSEASSTDDGDVNIVDQLRKTHQSAKISLPLNKWVKRAKVKIEVAEKYMKEVDEALAKSKDRFSTIDGDIEKAAAQVKAQRGVVRNGLPAASIVGLDIPVLTMDAYLRAEKTLAVEKPLCGISWWAIAAVGRIESNHGRYGGRALDQSGTAQPAIIGVALNGNGFAAIKDSDGGVLDGDTEWDRAVGVMQFIPGTWKRWGADGDGDGVANPQNVYDGALSAGRYLCSSAGMGTEAERRIAYMAYNRSGSYVDFVVGKGNEYAEMGATIFASTAPAG